MLKNLKQYVFIILLWIVFYSLICAVFLALHGHLDVVNVLLQKGHYTCDVMDSCGSTPLMDALRSGHIDIAELLISLNKVTHGSAVSFLTLANDLAELNKFDKY